MANSPADTAKAESRRLALVLKQQVRQRGSLATKVSQGLGRAPQYLTRVFAGRLELKMKDVWGTLALLGLDADDFFRRLYPIREPDGLAAYRRPLVVLDRLARGLEKPPLPAAEQMLEKSRRILRAWIVGAQRTQREISTEMGLSEDALGQALRGNTDLYAWHVFGVLAATGHTPDVFFDEACARDEALGLSPEQAAVLGRVLEATLAGLHEQLSTQPAPQPQELSQPTRLVSRGKNPRKKRV